MQHDEERSEGGHGEASRSQRRRRDRTRTYRRSGGLAVLVGTVAIGLLAFGGSGDAHVARSPKERAASTTTRSKKSGRSGSGSTTTAAPNGNATRLVDEWAACERRNGDSRQTDPTIDAHGVINITTPAPGRGGPAGDPHGVSGTCSEYLAAAQRSLRAADPVRDPLGMRNQADLLKYVGCMRASGVPNYPYPTGNTTNFNGTGVDPNSPRVVKISIKCGNKLGLPLWWSAGWGPPGDVSVSTAGLNPNSRLSLCAYKKTGCGKGIPVPGANHRPGSGFSPRLPAPAPPRATGPAPLQ